jgi:hypothetical protein
MSVTVGTSTLLAGLDPEDDESVFAAHAANASDNASPAVSALTARLVPDT